jgi:hypothetical protein
MVADAHMSSLNSHMCLNEGWFETRLFGNTYASDIEINGLRKTMPDPVISRYNFVVLQIADRLQLLRSSLYGLSLASGATWVSRINETSTLAPDPNRQLRKYLHGRRTRELVHCL